MVIRYETPQDLFVYESPLHKGEVPVPLDNHDRLAKYRQRLVMIEAAERMPPSNNFPWNFKK